MVDVYKRQIIHQLCKLIGEALLVMIGRLIQADFFQLIVRMIQDCSAGGFIHTAGLHTHKTVLHDVCDADAVRTAYLIEFCNKVNRTELLAIECDRNPLFKGQSDIRRLIGRLFRGNPQLQEPFLIVLRLICRVLEIEALMGKMPQIFILRIIGLTGDLQRDVVRFRIFDLILAGLQIQMCIRDSPYNVLLDEM